MFAPTPSSAPPSLSELQQRVSRMQGAVVARPLPLLPAFAGLARLTTGMTCSVDSAALALALLAGPSRAGEWVGVVGAPDLGLEAAAAFGMALERTVVVPEPGEHWLSVTAGLIEMVGLVLVQPPPGVTEQQAARLSARLRQKDAALLAWGDWPRSSLRLSAVDPRWVGLGQGHGHLQACRVRVVARQAGQPPQTADLWLPDADLLVVPVPLEPDAPVELAPVRAG